MSGMMLPPRSPSDGPPPPPPPSSSSSRHQQHGSSRSSSSSHHRGGGSSGGSHRSGGSGSSSGHHHRSSSSRNPSNPSSSHHDDKRKPRSSSSKSSSSKHHRPGGSSSKHDSRQRSKPSSQSSSNSVKVPPLTKTVEHPLKEMTKSSFLCNMKFQTGLPEIDLDPVLLEFPKDFTENFIGYKTTSLEKNHKFELLTENNLGINMNLINPFVYYNDENAKLDPEDELLLKPVETGKKEIAKELAENLSSRPSWLKAPSYVDMINYKKAIKSYGDDLIQVDEESLKIKPKTVPRKVEEKNRFEKAKQLDAKFKSETLYKTLPNGSKVKAIACYSLLPNFATIGTKFMAANFGSDNQSLLGKRGRYGELTAKDASDSLIIIQPTDDIILAEKAGDDRNINVAQYYVPVSNNDEDTLFNSEKTVGSVVELAREYNGTIYEKNSSNTQVNKENEKRFKLPNHLMSKDKMTQAEIEPCVALKFDDNTSQCFFTYINEGVNFKVLPKKKKRRVFTKVKLTGTNNEDVEFEDLSSIMARTEELGKPASTNEDEELNEQPQQQSEEEDEIIEDRAAAKKRFVQSDDEDENMEDSAPTGGEENMPTSPTGDDQRAPSSEDEFDEE